MGFYHRRDAEAAEVSQKLLLIMLSPPVGLSITRKFGNGSLAWG